MVEFKFDTQLLIEGQMCIRDRKCTILFIRSDSVKTKIKELRKINKVSQDELALAVGVTRQTIISLEKEKYIASLVLAYKIAKYFHLSIEEVFDFSDMEGMI